jgi:hypothetical protein
MTQNAAFIYENEGHINKPLKTHREVLTNNAKNNRFI